MIDNIAKLGKIYLNISGHDILDLYVDSLDNIEHVIAIKLDLTSGKYLGVDYAELDKSNPQKYLYKEVSSGGAGNSPTAKYKIKKLSSHQLSEDIKNKVLKRKILKWFDKYKEVLEKIDIEYFSKIKNLIQNNLDRIASDICNKINQLYIQPDTTIIITLVIKEDLHFSFIGKISKFRNAVMKCIENKWGVIDDKSSKGEAVCFICDTKKNVYGYALTSAGLIFATPDKPGFSPNLVRQDIWKYQPICGECSTYVKTGLDFINNHLKFRLDNLPLYYMSIPVTDDVSIYRKIIGIASTSGEFTDGLLNREDRLSSEAAKFGDVFYISYAILEKQQKRMILHSFIDIVYPSRLREIKIALEALEPLNYSGYMNNIMEKSFQKMMEAIRYSKINNRLYGYDWYVNVSAYLLTDRENKLYRDFLEFLTDILSGRKPNIKALIIRSMDKLRSLFATNYREFIRITYASMLLIMFISKLYKFNIFVNDSPVNLELNEYANRISDFLDQINIGDDALKAAFAIGVLVDYTFYIQRKVRGVERGEEPFRKKLLGLYITPSRLRNIFKEAVEKLNQYYGLTYVNNDLIKGISQLLLKAEPLLNRADTEYISYMFTLGMVLGNDLLDI